MSKNSGPTADPQVKALYDKFNQQLQAMEKEKKELQAKLDSQTGEASKGFKVKPLEKFDGKRSELRSFLIYTKLYLTFKEYLFSNKIKKILAVVAFLKG